MRPLVLRDVRSGQRAVTPNWSPGGTNSVSATFTAAAGTNIYTANADGTSVARITDGGDEHRCVPATSRPTAE
jgi:hypothetical protein